MALTVNHCTADNVLYLRQLRWAHASCHCEEPRHKASATFVSPR